MKRALWFLLLASCGVTPAPGASKVDGGIWCEVLEIGVVYCLGSCSSTICGISTVRVTNLELEALERSSACEVRIHRGSQILDCSSTSTVPAGANASRCGWTAEPGVCP